MLETLSIAAVLALLPISELRGALPYSLAQDVPLYIAYPFCVALNALVGPIVYLFLSTLHRLLERAQWYRKLFDRIVERARGKVHKKVERYGYFGLALFVAIPLPITGAYTGTFAAWLFDVEFKRTMLAVLVGVIISGIIVTTVMVLGIEWLMPLFTRRVG